MTEHSTAMAVPTWTLGDRLRKAREFAGLDQDDLAAAIGISRGTVSNYELGRGQKAPKVYVLRDWAKTCGVPLEWILPSTHDVSSESNGQLMSTTRIADAQFLLCGNSVAA